MYNENGIYEFTMVTTNSSPQTPIDVSVPSELGVENNISSERATCYASATDAYLYVNLLIYSCRYLYLRRLNVPKLGLEKTTKYLTVCSS